jgi:predicted nucleic acid-binding protein
MKALGVVVAYTTPLSYLIVIDRADILASLFGEVLIPEAVLAELRHPRTTIFHPRSCASRAGGVGRSAE